MPVLLAAVITQMICFPPAFPPRRSIPERTVGSPLGMAWDGMGWHGMAWDGIGFMIFMAAATDPWTAPFRVPFEGPAGNVHLACEASETG